MLLVFIMSRLVQCLTNLEFDFASRTHLLNLSKKQIVLETLRLSPRVNQSRASSRVKYWTVSIHTITAVANARIAVES